jgi:hypothetical protein
MKNIHVLPTDKPSRLIKNSNENKLYLCIQTLSIDEEIYCYPRHIYITSDEEIKEGDWCIVGNGVDKLNTQFTSKEEINTIWKKIILTTDQDLIKDGVQAIDDEFLEWFVKNPSCEFVEVEYIGYEKDCNIIIPKEKPKQDFYKIGNFDKNFDDGCKYHCTKGNTQLAECLKEPKQETFIKVNYIDGRWLSPSPTEREWQEEKLREIFGHYPNASPKWQYMNGLIQNSLDAKQMYSEEEVLDIIHKFDIDEPFDQKEWFEQFFKKK